LKTEGIYYEIINGGANLKIKKASFKLIITRAFSGSLFSNNMLSLR